MKKVLAIATSGLAAWVLAATLGARPTAPVPRAATSMLLTAWRCPITDQFFANPLTCKASCFGFTCQAVSQ